MIENELEKRIDQMRADFRAVTGNEFVHFFCPILHTDEKREMCRGHVIPKALETCDAWVPQVKDVDSFYGSVSEATFSCEMMDGSKTPFEKWQNPKLNKIYRPKLKVNGEELEHYFAKESKHFAGHTPVQVVGPNAELLTRFVIKKSPQEMSELSGTDIKVIVERDFRPAVIAAVLKAAHLTMFRMLGYSHVFSPAGRYLSLVLGDFYTRNRQTPRDEMPDALAAAFQQHCLMICPTILTDKALLSGTVKDNRILACIGANEGIYAIGVIVPAGPCAFLVFLPTGQGTTINTYLGFLKEPPPSILVSIYEFRCATLGTESFFSTSYPPFRIELLSSLP